MELARIRLRGVYAAVAGAVLLLVVPYFQGAFLASQGYITAVQPIATHHDFAPLLAWIAEHRGADRAMRLIGTAPYLLAVVLPPSLCLLLWGRLDRANRLARISGQGGFLLFLVAGTAGIVTSATATASYASATSAAARLAAAQSLATSYAIENLLSRTLGGLLLALFLALISLRVARTAIFPRWVAYVGLAVAALEAATALLVALAPAQAETGTSTFAHFGLAIWLLVVGL
ncbi:MAG TPA: hypothetical protein VFY89_03030, partial [Ktedonobacterales bacterium]